MSIIISEIPCFLCGIRSEDNIVCQNCLSERDQTIVSCKNHLSLHVKPPIKSGSNQESCYPYEISHDPEKGR